MAFNLNRVMLAGNLTRDPQVRFFANERAKADFGLAINHRYKTADGQQKEEVTFVDIEAWGRTAELVGQYLTKGRPCYVEGRMKLDSWEDKDGQKRQKLKVVADSVQFLGAPGERGPSDRGASEAGDDSSASAPASAPQSAKVSKQSAAPAAAAGDDEPPF
jgi:single-strand DNA-binding protein